MRQRRQFVCETHCEGIYKYFTMSAIYVMWISLIKKIVRGILL